MYDVHVLLLCVCMSLCVWTCI